MIKLFVTRLILCAELKAHARSCIKSQLALSSWVLSIYRDKSIGVMEIHLYKNWRKIWRKIQREKYVPIKHKSMAVCSDARLVPRHSRLTLQSDEYQHFVPQRACHKLLWSFRIVGWINIVSYTLNPKQAENATKAMFLHHFSQG